MSSSSKRKGGGSFSSGKKNLNSKSTKTSDPKSDSDSTLSWVVSRYLRDFDGAVNPRRGSNHANSAKSNPDSKSALSLSDFPHPAWKTETAGVEKQKNIFEDAEKKWGLKYAFDNHKISPTFKQFEDLGDLVMRDLAGVGWNLLTGQRVVGSRDEGGAGNDNADNGIPLGKFLEESELVQEKKKFGEGEVVIWNAGGMKLNDSSANDNSNPSGGLSGNEKSGKGSSPSSSRPRSQKNNSKAADDSESLVLAFRFRYPAVNEMMQTNFGLSEVKGCETPRNSESSASASSSDSGGVEDERLGWMLMNGPNLCVLRCFWEDCGEGMMASCSNGNTDSGGKGAAEAWAEGGHKTGGDNDFGAPTDSDKESGEDKPGSGFFAEASHEGKGSRKGKTAKHNIKNKGSSGNISEDSISVPSDSISSLTPVPSKKRKNVSKSSASESVPSAADESLSENFSSLSFTATSSKSNLIPIPTPKFKRKIQKKMSNDFPLPPDALAIELQIFPRNLYEDFRISLTDVGKVRGKFKLRDGNEKIQIEVHSMPDFLDTIITILSCYHSKYYPTFIFYSHSMITITFQFSL
jgi:hypothetical protein